MPSSSPHAPAGRREHRKHVTREEILAAGRRLFGEMGLYESRIEDLTREAGIAKGTIYGYFPNKEALILAVAAKGYGELLAHVRERSAGTRAGTARLRRIARAHVEFMAGNPDLMRVLRQVRGMLMFARREWRPLRSTLAEYLDGLAEVIAGGPAGPVAGAQARALFGAVSGALSTHAALADGSLSSVPTDALSAAATAFAIRFARSARTVAAPRPRLPAFAEDFEFEHARPSSGRRDRQVGSRGAE